MALINVKKKIEKSANKLGITEPVLAACTTNPSGTMKRMLAKELGGVIGAAMTPGGAVDPDNGMASDFPNGQHLLALTETRLLVTSMSALSGKPKEIVAQWPHENISAIEVEDARMSHPMTIVFTDGTALQVEGAKGTNPRSIAEAFDE